jgi:hypothetical protein
LRFIKRLPNRFRARSVSRFAEWEDVRDEEAIAVATHPLACSVSEI